MNKDKGYTWKLGMFVLIALVGFGATIYFVGKQKNLFGETMRIQSTFKNVSGLQVGNNIRFSGITIGTVADIQIVSDSSVVVGMLIKQEVQKFIKTDATASIGSNGLMGDKVLVISPGIKSNTIVKNGNTIASTPSVEMDDIMKSVKTSMENASVITEELAQFSYDMNHGNGALSKLMTDEKFSNNLSKTMTNLQTSTKGLSDNMEAAKHNILLRGFFNKKKREEEKKKEEAEKAKQEAIEAAKDKK
jgi:phospholipid/cholesterol/gamma-HCH transport system substrate-binding protein